MDLSSLPADTIIKENYWNLGAGITFDGYSFDGGQSWYLLIEGELIEEELMNMALHANCMCGLDL